jgi:hypothetical protein
MSTSIVSLSTAGMPPPLKGVRIVDLTRILAGPTATMLLSDLVRPRSSLTTNNSLNISERIADGHSLPGTHRERM